MKKKPKNKLSEDEVAVLADANVIYIRNKKGSRDVTKDKYLDRSAIIDAIKSEHRINSIRKRLRMMDHPIRFTVCG